MTTTRHRPATPDELRTLAPIAGRVDCPVCEGAGAYVEITHFLNGTVYFGETLAGTVRDAEVSILYPCGCTTMSPIVPPPDLSHA